MTEYNYDDFKSRLNILDILEYAGYHRDKRAGYKFPIYVKLDSVGQVVHGDKFMVTGGGNCCARPGTMKNYNIISFITEHPNMFPQFRAGMDPHRLVNLVCNELLHNPIEHKESYINYSQREHAPFDLEKYNVFRLLPQSYESEKKFEPFFKARGIDLYTQYSFRDSFFLASKKNGEKFTFSNLSFPLTIPGKEGIVGLEERGKPDKDGKTYKGKAAGSNGSEGLWIANLSGKPLEQASKVLWFESAYDAMSYYQLYRQIPQKVQAVYISTGGNPTENQFRGVLAHTEKATHHLCFDNDEAGRTFTANFALIADGQRPSTTNATINPELFTMEAITQRLREASNVKIIPAEFHDYVSSLLQEDNIYSGDADLLPESVGKLYAKYDKLSQELYSTYRSGMICPEDFAEMKEKATKANEEYKTAMTEALGTSENRHIMRLLPDEPYKDWNEQLLASMEISEELHEENNEEFHRHR